jgi:hypothetical protein
MTLAPLPSKQELARHWSRRRQQFIDRLAGLFGQLKLDWSPGLPLAGRCSVDGVAVRGNIFDLNADDVATAQLAVDCEVE